MTQALRTIALHDLRQYLIVSLPFWSPLFLFLFLWLFLPFIIPFLYAFIFLFNSTLWCMSFLSHAIPF